MSFGSTNAAVLTGTIVTLGRWSEGESLSIKIVIGVAFLAVGLAAMNEANPALTSSFGLLILTAAALRYAVPIINKTGITKA
jgi:hypothetical protein